MPPSSERYAVYFAPAGDTALWRAGCRWLGRDMDRPDSGADPLPPHEAARAGLSREGWMTATAEARRYGFHATLKPPFALADGCDLSDLDTALARFAAHRRAFAGPMLRITRLDGFLALCPMAPDSGLDALAADCVRTFDAFRRPSSPEDLARRRARGLSPRQETMLETWGYPYVMDDFRFHMTLTGRLDDDAAGRLIPLLEGVFADALADRLAVDGVSLCRERVPGEAFETVRRYLFSAR